MNAIPADPRSSEQARGTTRLRLERSHGKLLLSAITFFVISSSLAGCTSVSTRIQRVQQAQERGDVDSLVAALEDEIFGVRSRAAESLREIGEPAVEPLIVALENDKFRARPLVLYLLIKIGGDRAIEPIFAALKDQDKRIRMSAAEALGEIGGDRAVEPLVDALKDEDMWVRMSAAEALGEIGGDRAVELLVDALKDEDLVIVAGAHRFFIRKGKRGTENLLVSALGRYGHIVMAQNFLNSGNSRLSEAGRVWAIKNGYTIRPSPVGRSWGQRWGSEQ